MRARGKVRLTPTPLSLADMMFPVATPSSPQSIEFHVGRPQTRLGRSQVDHSRTCCSLTEWARS